MFPAVVMLWPALVEKLLAALSVRVMSPVKVASPFVPVKLFLKSVIAALWLMKELP